MRKQEFINKRNPVLPVEYYIPDAEAHVMSDGKLYVFESFDNKDGAYCCEKYYVVSTPDMEHWTIHDEAIFRYVRSEQGYSGVDILQQEQGMLK